MSTNSKSPFSTEDQEKILLWWNDLENDKGSRASLRRKQKPDEVAFERTASSIYYLLSEEKPRFEHCLAWIGLLAHIKEDVKEKTFGGYLAGEGTDKARISETRFKRLLSIEDRDEMYRAFIRVLRHLKGNAPILNLIEHVHWWNDISKRELAKDYYRILTKSRGDEDNSLTDNN
jgi:CRISPR system Cascade subunit CasB